MKVTLRRSYLYEDVMVDPVDSAWNQDFVVEMEQPRVLKILEIQTKMEELRQQLKPLYDACVETHRINEEAKKALEEEAEEAKSIISDSDLDEAL